MGAIEVRNGVDVSLSMAKGISSSPSVIDNGLPREIYRSIHLKASLATMEPLFAYTKTVVFLKTTLSWAKTECILRFGRTVIGTLKDSLSIRKQGMFGLTNTDHRAVTS
jgi:hypothetical protein